MYKCPVCEVTVKNRLIHDYTNVHLRKVAKYSKVFDSTQVETVFNKDWCK